MGLSDLLARTAVRSAHVLVVEVPGWWRTRMAVERAVKDRGWRPALAPADADVLVVCGEPGPRLGEAVALVWEQMPGPRVRVDVPEYGDVAERLDEAQARLLDTTHHRHDARHRPAAADLLANDSDDDHGGHEGMDHGDMEMSPGGIPLAEGGQDRDGLEMDVLNVRLGPVLPRWPAGLVLRCSLQGDVIVEAEAEPVDPVPDDDADADHPARRLDSVAAVLALAGWDDAAAQARRARDTLLDLDSDPDPDSVDAVGTGLLDRLHRRVRRSRTLRWSLRGVRPVTEEDLRRHGFPADALGDSHDRLLRMLDRVREPVRTGDPAAAYSARQVAGLVTGLDLATARLVVAGLGPLVLARDHAEREVSHG